MTRIPTRPASMAAIVMTLIFAPLPAEEIPDIRVNGERLLSTVDGLAEFGGTADGGVSRVAFSQDDRRAREYLQSLMREAGLEVRIDEAGNIIGRREGQIPGLPPIVCGSHSDTVPGGGRFDGAVGVLSAVECARALGDEEILLRHPLEVIVFTDEEGGLVGSGAMIGSLTPEVLAETDEDGRSVREGIRFLGGDPDRLDRAVRKQGQIRAFLEIHIEQGGTLEFRNVDAGIVEGIVGIRRWEVVIEGQANHAGTTPMDMRHDSLLAAAHLIIAVNKIVTSIPGRQVGTVGRIRAAPGAPNVIPGRVVLSLELRDMSLETIGEIFDRIRHEAEAAAATTGTRISFHPAESTALPAPTDPHIRDLIRLSAQALGLSSLSLPSGAGHDAQNMARIAPTGMIFIPSVGGISHSPREYSRPQDIVNGADLLLRTILLIDREQEADGR